MLPTPLVTDAYPRDSALHQQEAKGSQQYLAIDPHQERNLNENQPTRVLVCPQQ